MNEKIEMLRRHMKKKDLDFYMIPTSDFHNSEYVGDYFKIREYYSGFTGSNGTLLVGMHMAGLWTDGRYFVQAAKELQGSGITLFRMGEENVPTIPEFIREHGKKGVRIGFDGRILRKNYVERMVKKCKNLIPKLVYEEDLAGLLWQDRPTLSAEKAYALEEIEKYIIPTQDVLPFAVFEPEKKDVEKLFNGMTVFTDYIDGLYKIYREHVFYGILEVQNNRAKIKTKLC